MQDRTFNRASLELLRAEARDELETMIEDRGRDGRDPWEFMQELPTVDEMVVWILHSDAVLERPAVAPEDDYRVLRQIAIEHPSLTSTVWRLLGTLAA